MKPAVALVVMVAPFALIYALFVVLPRRRRKGRVRLERWERDEWAGIVANNPDLNRSTL